MITLTDPTIDELQAVITAMAKVHPELSVSGTLSIARAEPTATGHVDDDEVTVVGDDELVDAFVAAASDESTNETPEVVSPPTETATNVAPATVEPEQGRKTMGYTDADLIELVAGQVDLDQPINRQIIDLVDCPRGSVHPIKRRCVELGLIPPSTIRTMEG